MDIHESVHKLLTDQQVLSDQFYERLLIGHPEFRPYFRDVDLKRQAVLLGMTLLLIEHHYIHRYPTSASYLEILGHRHQARHGIPAELYPTFGRVLLETLAGYHGDEWNDRLARQWSEAIEVASQAMLAGYDQDIHV